MRITIYSVGKIKERWLSQAIGEYVKRLQAWGEVEFHFVKDDQKLFELLSSKRDYICLDEKGVSLTSEKLASWLSDHQRIFGAHLEFVIGGADGLPEKIKRERKQLSLSPLTLTHQMAHLLLVEQLYRVHTLLSGKPYHRF